MGLTLLGYGSFRAVNGAVMVTLRTSFMAAALAALVWFNFFNTAPAQVLGQKFVDQFDERPARRMLFVGNSRMFFNDMPRMVRKIADSAGANQKYQITMWATPGETLEGHWNKGKVKKLLDEGGWHEFVLQAESGAHHDEYRSRFAEYGAKFVDDARKRGIPASLIVGWAYGVDQFDGNPEGQAYHHARIQSDHRSLARTSGAKLINVGSTWRELEQSRPAFPLTSDGNHPTVQGSYLAALVIYAHLSGDDLARVTFVPDEMTAEEGALIREFAASSLRWRIS